MAKRPFRLLRYFTAVSLPMLVGLAVALGWLHATGIKAAVENTLRHESEVLTRSMLNALRAPLAQLTEGRPADLNAATVALVRDTLIAKIKIMDGKGRVLFSTDPAEAGRDDSANPRVRRALNGEIVIITRSLATVRFLDGAFTDREVVATYVPFRYDGGRGKPDGVFELYHDVTALLAEIERQRRDVVLTAGGTLLAAYLLLLFLTRYADARIRRAQEYLASENDRLEERIAQRTTALEQSAAEFRTAFEFAPHGMVLATADGTILRCNVAFRTMLDYSDAELRTLGWKVLTHPDDTQNSLAAIEAFHQGRTEAFRFGKRYRARDGEYVWCEISIAPILGNDGKPACFIIHVHDIRERRRAEAALKDSEARFRAVFEQSVVGLAVTAADGRWLQANPALCRMVGRNEEEMLATTISAITHPDDRGKDDAWIARVVAGENRLYDEEKRYLRPNGDAIWVRVTGSVLRDAAGRPERFIAQINDISERKRAETVLRDSEARLRAFFDSPALGNAIVSPEGQFIEVNRALCETLGYSPAEFTRLSVADIVDPDDWPDHRDRVIRARYGAVPRLESEVRTRAKSGHILWLAISGSLIRDANGKAAYFVTQTMDVTSRRAAEAALRLARDEAEIANRAKTEFLANMSHELRTPLNAILGFTDAITHGVFGPINNAHYEAYLDNVHHAAEHLLTMISDILDLSKLDVGELVVSEDDLDLSEVIRTPIELLRPRAEAKRVRLLSDIPDSPPRFRADGLRAKQVLINLLSNAVKFSPPGSDVRLSGRPTADGGLRLTVTDHGPGMSPAEIDRALTQFGGNKNPWVRTGEGAGLGLPICRRLMETMGGTLRIASAPDRGTEVTVEFRCQRTEDGKSF